MAGTMSQILFIGPSFCSIKPRFFVPRFSNKIKTRA